MQTLLVGVACCVVLGLLPGRVAGNPGRRSLRLACPGLYYAALSGLKKTEGEAINAGSCVYMKSYA